MEWRRDGASPKLLIRVWSEAGSGSRDRKRADGSPANWLECRWCDSLCLRAALHPLVTWPLPASNMRWRHIILFSGRPCQLQSTAERWRAFIKRSFLLQQHASTLFITNLFSYSVQTVHLNNLCTILALKNALILPKIYKTLQFWWKILKTTASASLDVPVCAASAAFVVRVSAKQAFSSTSGMRYYCQHKTVNWLCDPSGNWERQIAFNLNWQSSEEQDGFIHCCPVSTGHTNDNTVHESWHKQAGKQRASFLMPLNKWRESRWRTKALNSLYTVCWFFSIGKFHSSLNIWVISKTTQEHSFCDLSIASRSILRKFQ